MKTKLAIAMLMASSVAMADGPKAPDFLGKAPSRHIDRSLTASQAGTPIDPGDVVAFKLDSEILSDGGIAQVDSTARWLKAHPRYRVVLEGHTDIIGLTAYNEDLANRRINTVRSRLLRRGVHSDRIVMVTYGETEATYPENPNDRRVVMFATTLPVRAVVNASLDRRLALVAMWTDRKTVMQLQHGIGRPANAQARPAKTMRR